MIIKYKTRLFECILDIEDEVYFNQWNWYYRNGYVGRQRTKLDKPGNKWVHLHREVLFKNNEYIPEGHCVDHINRNKMDNRKENLRIVTRSENGKNVDDDVKRKRTEFTKHLTKLAAQKPKTIKQLEFASKQAKSLNLQGKNKHIGEDNYASKKVINIISKKIYVNIREAALYEGHNYSTLKSKLNGSLKNNTNLLHLDKYHSIFQDLSVDRCTG